MAINAVSPTITLNTGAAMPQLGLGVWQTPDEDTRRGVRYAIDEAGYRLIDTAKIYGNEAAVGQGIHDAEVDRSELFVTTKLWNADHGRDATLRAIDGSLDRLGLDYVDLYLIHWPLLNEPELVETWHAMEEIAASGKAKAIGVCNFKAHHIQLLLDESDTVPAVDQIELHPHLPQYVDRAFNANHGIVTESWSPLGGSPRRREGSAPIPNQLLTDPVITAIAEAHDKSAAQIIIRWHLQNGLVVIPKSVHDARIKQNIDVFDFALTGKDMEAIARLDNGERVGSDPDSMDRR